MNVKKIGHQNFLSTRLNSIQKQINHLGQKQA